MNAIVKSLIAISIAASFSLNAYADERKPDTREQKRDKFEQMRPSERQDMRQEMRRERNDEAAPQQRREMRERFEHMTPHERREMREDMRHRSRHHDHQNYAYGNQGNARIVLGGHEGLVIQRVEFMLGF